MREAEACAKPPKRVPLYVLKNICAVLLLPAAWVWTVSFLGSFRRASQHHNFCTTEDFWFFALGVVLWLLFFSGCLYLFGEPRGRWLYVLGHESTHAALAILSLGKVANFTVRKDGGHILTDKPTVLVTLAPYFYPIPCVILIIFASILSLFYPWHEAPPLLVWNGFVFTAMEVFFLLFGLGWGFHISFTVWMIRKGQSDLRMHGNFFSLVLIYLGNLAFLTLLLLVTARGIGFRAFFKEFLRNAEDFSEWVWSGGVFFVHVCRQLVQ